MLGCRVERSRGRAAARNAGGGGIQKAGYFGNWFLTISFLLNVLLAGRVVTFLPEIRTRKRPTSVQIIQLAEKIV